MSWDLVLFNSRQKITSIEEVDDTKLEPTDFCSAFESNFSQIIKDDDYSEIKGKDFAIDYFVDEDKVSNKMVSLYGDNGLFELVELAKKHNWQIFDTGNGQMIDLENLQAMVTRISRSTSVMCSRSNRQADKARNATTRLPIYRLTNKFRTLVHY